MNRRTAAALVAASVAASGALGATVFLSGGAYAAPTRYEAESATISQGVVESNHLNFSGTGFVNGDNAAGSYTEFTLNAASAGTGTIGIRYSNGTTVDRPSTITVNGAAVATGASFPSTTDWDTWTTKTVTAPVNAGANTVRLTATTANGNPNLDYVDFDVAVASNVYQAEDATLSQAAVATNHTGYTGTGFVDYTNVTGSYTQFGVTVATAGTYTLTLRYSNGTTVDRPMTIAVNGTDVATGVSFPATTNWDTWVDKAVTVTLAAGANTVRATATTANGGPNLDKITVAAGGTTSPSPSPSPSPTSGTPGFAVAPYEYFGWGNPQNPTSVMSATGVKWFTLAFILSDGTCNPAWDGSRPLTGGDDQAKINAIRAAGGDVIPSFGGYSGAKLGEHCSSASALAGAYQKVINAYSLKAIDIDIEDTEWASATVRQRVIDALKIIKTNNPGIKTVVTFGVATSGPDSTGVDMITRGANSGLANDVWSIMPFDFGGHSGSMGSVTVTAADGLKNAVKSAYGYTDAVAYAHIGISSMNGKTDETDETVSTADFTTILNYAKSHHIGRLTYWSINRDRPCGTGTDGDSCSGVSQSQYDFLKIFVQFTG
ncbi:CBM35 domain-containing protein [Hamadaea tsunoensis]|uniref:CBM35 domain-containing protein n=1 Tax=Hamadaea tsunoensis TaxID=53368 RepID=UPI0004141D00|nr:CBM35 domain-containing protein [Hamadaea tsunoensis]